MIKQFRVPIATLAASIAGLAFIGAEEGTGPVVTTSNGVQVALAYADPAHGWAVPTICHGHTQGVFKGQQASLEQCQQWLIEDTRRECAAIGRVTPVAMTQAQYDAICSFAVNVGQGNYARSVMARKINAGDCHGAAREFNAAPQIDRKTGQPIIWNRPSIIDRSTGAVLLARGDTVKKWTTANDIPLPGIIKRRASERAMFEQGCAAW